MSQTRLNILRICAFALVLTVAAIGVAGAIGGDGGDTRSTAEQRAAQRALDGPQRAAGAPTVAERRRGRRGPRGRRGKPGPRGPAGAAGTDQVLDLSVNWRQGSFAGRDTAQTTLPGIGLLQLKCNPSQQTLSLAPAQSGPRTVMTLTTFQGAGSYDNALNNRYVSQSPSDPIVVGLPVNGMIAGTASVELISGAGGAGATPATLNLTSYLKVNDPDPGQNFCFIAAQVIYKGV